MPMESSATSRGDEVYDPTSDVKFEENVAEGELTYGGFISVLQGLGVEHRSARTNMFGIPVGRGHHFSVYRHIVSAIDYQSMWLSISGPGHERFDRPVPRDKTLVAIKRIRVKDETGEIDISSEGQLYALCREVSALLHPNLRDHDSIIKLQAIIWENGMATGHENGPPLWPSLVMEYCDVTLADYQLRKSLAPLEVATICQKIGEGLDALHLANIFHGDLKSENVLLKIGKDSAIEPKLADFGCSITLLDSEGKTRYRITGTELWCAPECPGWFTAFEAIEATDWYSFGLLMLRIEIGGRNPFEEFGVIPEEWTLREKVGAIKLMKETDSLYALICGNEGIESLPPPARFLARSLLADPVARMEAVNTLASPEASGFTSLIEEMKSLKPTETRAIPDFEKAVSLLESAREKATSSIEAKDMSLSLPSTEEEERDLRDPLSFVSSFMGKNSIPDCSILFETKRRSALNSATKTRIIQELSSILEAEGISPPRSICRECCRLGPVDQDRQILTTERLLQELQQHLQNPSPFHTCQQHIGSVLSSSDLKISVAIFGAIREPAQDWKWKAIWQLFLATATGFGTPKDPRRALQILEDACASGFTAVAKYVSYAIYTKQQVSHKLPLRTWLVTSVLFSAGIPSDSFSALRELDPSLSKLVALARSQVYNGSTASFDNLRFNALHPRDCPGLEIIAGFKFEDGSHLVQDELFENTLLHLAAGSHGTDLSMIPYCIDVLGIEIDARNASGATPLLLASRAGREEKIIVLLRLGADVNLHYEGGETPLHWIGLVSNPSRLLDEFLRRDADITAQVEKPKLLPNFIDGTRRFFLASSPLVWAMAMENDACVEALLRRGAALHNPNSNGSSAIDFACWPRLSRFLPRLSREKTFRVRMENVYKIIASWSPWNEMGLVTDSIEPADQQKALELVLSFATPFDNIEEVYNFYLRPVSEAISESPIEILEIIFKALICSLDTVHNPTQNHGDFVKSPFSHPFWADHYFVHEAARRGDSEVLKAVLRMNVDPAAIDSFGWSALHILSSHSDNPDCVDVLVSNGVLEVLDTRLPGWGLSAFMNAILCCNFEVADRLLFYTPPADRKLLLSSHPAPGIRGPELSLIGHFVAWSPHFGKEPLEYLLRLPDFRDTLESVFIGDQGNKTTLLMIAAGFLCDGAVYDDEYFATWRRKSTYKLILTTFHEPRHINMKDHWGSTALHLAAWNGNLDIARMLMDHGAELNPVDKNGCTPLDMLFLPDPPYLQQDRDWKGMMIENFEKGRNGIYTALKSRGGIHKIRVVEPQKTTEDFPRPNHDSGGARYLSS